MTFFNYNFLCVQSFTLEFGVAVLTAFFTILTLLIVVFNVSELSSMISDNPIVLITIFLLLLTWLMAIAGANSRSRTLIALSIVIWAIFLIVWLVLSLYFRILMQNTDFCVSYATRCAPSMWLIGSNGGYLVNDTETPDSPELTTESPEINERRRLWTIMDLPEITFKTFHPVRTNVLLQATPATSADNTVISNQTTMMIGVNNGCGCERHPRTTTESPPSDLITRVIKYRKNMAMYRQTAEAAIRRKKKEGKKIKDVLDDDSDDEDTTTEEPTEDENTDTITATADPIEYLTMAIFLLLFLYALYVLLSYHSELKFMRNCKCTFLT
ncbi:uncharacterized protein LOC132933862 [Metopolophium dirhodum]|uniref:uncharacterized protein LOC132933862 n=1 Tax=Metopolophium dirhodum TaxID=44670 RepID=UPI00298F680A|nr:uncharacterized protein LOC132933862 [Metopolophium dirhodum]